MNCRLVSYFLVALVLLFALPGCRSVPQQSRPLEQRRPAKAAATATVTPIPLIVKALTSVLLQRHPTAPQVAHCLRGTALKDDMADGYRIKSADARFEEATVRLSQGSVHPSREAIVEVTLWLKPGQVLRLSALSHVFGKQSPPHIITTLGPSPDSVLLGHPHETFYEDITVVFPNAPGAGIKHDARVNPIQLDLHAQLMHEPGPAFPDPLVTEVNIQRNDWSDIR